MVTSFTENFAVNVLEHVHRCTSNIQSVQMVHVNEVHCCMLVLIADISLCFLRLGVFVFHRVSVKSFPDYKHLLQKNYVEQRVMQL